MKGDLFSFLKLFILLPWIGTGLLICLVSFIMMFTGDPETGESFFGPGLLVLIFFGLPTWLGIWIWNQIPRWRGEKTPSRKNIGQKNNWSPSYVKQNVSEISPSSDRAFGSEWPAETIDKISEEVLADKTSDSSSNPKNNLDTFTFAGNTLKKKESKSSKYQEFLFFFYNKTYPSGFINTYMAQTRGLGDILGGINIPSPDEWNALQNSCTRGINPSSSFKVNDRLFFILLHGFVAPLQSDIEFKYENPFTGFSMSQHGFSRGDTNRGEDFFKEHVQDITKITGTSFSYEEFSKVVDHYELIYHIEVQKAIMGKSTTMMDDLEFDFRIGMKAGILNTEVMIESLSISGFDNILKSFYPVLKQKLKSFSEGELNCYCNDFLYRYSNIANIEKGTNQSAVISSFKNDRIEIYDNINTTITLNPDAMDMFDSIYEEKKDNVQKFTISNPKSTTPKSTKPKTKKSTKPKTKKSTKPKTKFEENVQKAQTPSSTPLASKKAELKEAKELFDEDLINEKEYEQMKKEILGK